MTDEINKEAEPQAPAAPGRAPATLRALLGEKVGMTQMFTAEGELKAATIVRAGPCPVIRVKSRKSKDGYEAVVLGFGPCREKGLPKAYRGQFKAAGVPPVRHVREFRVPDAAGFQPGQIADLGEERFKPGDYVDVQGTSKGKGFAGVMKRHGFRGLPASHGASDKERSPGSLTARRSLGRVLPGQRMAGHMGHETVTVQKLEVLAVDADKQWLYLYGAVPGPNGSLVAVQETVKRLKHKPAPVKKSTVKRDKMGNIITDDKAKKAKKK